MTTSTKAELTLAAALVLAFMLGALVGVALAGHLDQTLASVCSVGRW